MLAEFAPHLRQRQPADGTRHGLVAEIGHIAEARSALDAYEHRVVIADDGMRIWLARFDPVTAKDMESLLDVGFALVSPERREGVTESEWSACMVDRLEADPPGSVYSYEHDRTWTEQVHTFAEGRVAAEADGTVWANRYVKLNVTEVGGERYVVAWVAESQPDCLGSPLRNG